MVFCVKFKIILHIHLTSRLRRLIELMNITLICALSISLFTQVAISTVFDTESKHCPALQV